MLLEQGKGLFRSGEFEKCERLIRNSVQLERVEPDVTELYAYTLQKLGQFEKAMGFWNLLIIKNSMNPEYYCERGVCKFNLGFRSALEDMDKAQELDPENPYRYSSKAYILDKLGRTEEAYHAYLKAADLDPQDDITQNNLGILEYKLGYDESSRRRFMEQEERLGISKMQSGSREIPTTSGRGDTQSSIRPNTKWKEVRKMLSSGKEFITFIKEAFHLLRKK